MSKNKKQQKLEVSRSQRDELEDFLNCRITANYNCNVGTYQAQGWLREIGKEFLGISCATVYLHRNDGHTERVDEANSYVTIKRSSLVSITH